MQQQVYSAIRKKHSLPSMEEMIRLFDIDTIPDDAKHPAKEIAKKVFERIDLFRKMLEELLQPENLTSMEEAGFYSDIEMRQISAIFRKLMALDRTLLVAELKNTEDSYGSFVSHAISGWQEITDELRPIVEKLPQGWANNKVSKQTHHYMG